MRSKRKLLWIAIIMVVVLSAIVFMVLITTWSKNVDRSTPEYAIQKAFGFPYSEYQYNVLDGVLFAVTTERDGTSRYTVLIRDEEKGKFRPLNIQNMLALGKSMYGFGFNADTAGASLYEEYGKYIFVVPIPGYSLDTNPEPGRELIDLTEVSMYDSNHKPLEYVEGEKFRLYYSVNDELPKDFAIIMNYKGKEHTLLDSSNLFPEEVINSLKKGF